MTFWAPRAGVCRLRKRPSVGHPLELPGDSGALVMSNQAALHSPCTLQPGLWGVQGRECAESHQLEG